uniref:Uncharacterized protein n=1 Tax=Arundo donax TaxID=35708 RepID=A0A0A9CL78_ARUDO
METNIWNGASRSAFGEGTCCKMESSNEDIFFALSGGLLVNVKEAHPSLADAYRTGKSNCSSVAPRFAKRSKTKLSTSLHVSSETEGLSTLLRRRIGCKPYFKAFESTNLVCAKGPSPASTTKTAPSTIPTTRSTSPPKSA